MPTSIDNIKQFYLIVIKFCIQSTIFQLPIEISYLDFQETSRMTLGLRHCSHMIWLCDLWKTILGSNHNFLLRHYKNVYLGQTTTFIQVKHTWWDALKLCQTLGNNIFLHPMFILMNLTYDFSVFEGLELYTKVLRSKTPTQN